MTLEITWFRWTCDWCRQKANMAGGKTVLPFGWVEDNRQGVQFMAGSHFCGNDCVTRFRTADRVVGQLAQELAQRIANQPSTLFDLDAKDFKLTLYHRGHLVQEDR